MRSTKTIFMKNTLHYLPKYSAILSIVAILFMGCGGGGTGGGTTPPPIDSFNQLTVSVTGGGTISSNPAGIDCGSDCSQDYSSSTQVNLTAQPDAGFIFNGWGGACSGTGTCVINMSSNLSVTADFVSANNNTEYQLTVAIQGFGRVTSNPTGIDCGNDCNEIYPQSTLVTLQPTADAGFQFSHWVGACSGNVTCQIDMTEDKSATAHFIDPVANTVLIENYLPQGDAFQLGDIPNNASGITWHDDLQQYLVVRNGSALIYRYDINFAYMGLISVNGINTDTEGLAYINNNETLIVSENNVISKLNIDEFSTLIDGELPNSQQYHLLPLTVSNKGLEGVAVRLGETGNLNRVYACQEGTGTNSAALMRVVYFDMSEPDPLVLLSFDNNLEVIEPFNAEQAFSGVVTDLAGMLYDDRTGHLIIVSQEARKAIQVNPETGTIISQLDLTGAPQFEGVTLGPNNELVFVSEGNWIRIYTLN